MRVFVALLLLACSDPEDPGTGPDGGSDGGSPSGAVGRLRVMEFDGFSDWGMVHGLFHDEDPAGPDLANDGTCRLYEWPCLGQVGACAQPPGISAGRITVTGLAVPVSMVPSSFTGEYFLTESAPADLFADDAAIEATAAGGTLSAFTLSTTGVSPMMSSYAGADLPPFGAGPVEFTWTPAAGSGARVQMRLNVASFCHAGSEWAILDCEADDAAGRLTVSAEMIAAIPDGYVSGCGGSLTRFRRDTSGGIELFVGSADYFDVFQL